MHRGTEEENIILRILLYIDIGKAEINKSSCVLLQNCGEALDCHRI
jgi:hypothetical protein